MFQIWPQGDREDDGQWGWQQTPGWDVCHQMSPAPPEIALARYAGPTRGAMGRGNIKAIQMEHTHHFPELLSMNRESPRLEIVIMKAKP